jgi:MFS family permease
VSGVGAGAAAGDGRASSPLRWVVLGLAALAIYSSYYESDAIGPIADLLGRQRGFTQSQIGDLTAVISLPNILLAVFNGLLIDRYGPARVTLWAAVIGFVGSVLTAIGTPYELMWTGRLIAAIMFRLLDSRYAAPTSVRPVASPQFNWVAIWKFGLSYWYILALHVLRSSTCSTSRVLRCSRPGM